MAKPWFFFFVPLLFFDQLILAILLHFSPQHIVHTVRWFSLVSTPVAMLSAAGIILLLELLFQLHKNAPLGLLLILTGYLSNLLSFFIHRAIWDYIPLPTSTINAADLMIIGGCGVVLYLLFIVRSSQLSLPNSVNQQDRS